MYETKPYFYGTGRRKHSVARVRVYNGTGKMTINGRDINDYFGLETLKLLANSPLVLTENEGKFDVVVNVVGGGCAGQAGAIRHGLSRALLQFNPELRSTLKKAGFLTRDPRMKERKKYALTRYKCRKTLRTCAKKDRAPFGRATRRPLCTCTSATMSCCQKSTSSASLISRSRRNRKEHQNFLGERRTRALSSTPARTFPSPFWCATTRITRNWFIYPSFRAKHCKREWRSRHEASYCIDDAGKSLFPSPQ